MYQVFSSLLGHFHFFVHFFLFYGTVHSLHQFLTSSPFSKPLAFLATSSTFPPKYLNFFLGSWVPSFLAASPPHLLVHLSPFFFGSGAEKVAFHSSF